MVKTIIQQQNLARLRRLLEKSHLRLFIGKTVMCTLYLLQRINKGLSWSGEIATLQQIQLTIYIFNAKSESNEASELEVGM